MNYKEILIRILEKMEGHCHFCGDPVDFEMRGWKWSKLAGYWETDHELRRRRVIQNTTRRVRRKDDAH